MKVKNFYIIFVVSVLILTGCTSDKRMLQESEAARAELKAELENVKRELIAIAGEVGIPYETASAVSTKELLSDIENRLGNEHPYRGKTLTNEDFKNISIYLGDREEIQKKIKDYHEYIQQMHKTEKVIIIENNQQ